MTELDHRVQVREALLVPPSDPDCNRCQHHYVTYESQWPHGCRAFDFKSKAMPRVVVKDSSGEECSAFEARPKASEEGPGRS